MPYEVETWSLPEKSTAIGAAGPFTLVVDRPTTVGGGGLGFSGGDLLYLAVAACVSNDIYREAAARGIKVSGVHVRVQGDFAGDPAVSDEIIYSVDIEADAPDMVVRDLVHHVDRIAEIPNSLRAGTPVRLVGADG